MICTQQKSRLFISLICVLKFLFDLILDVSGIASQQWHHSTVSLAESCSGPSNSILLQLFFSLSHLHSYSATVLSLSVKELGLTENRFFPQKLSTAEETILLCLESPCTTCTAAQTVLKRFMCTFQSSEVTTLKLLLTSI